MIQEKFFSIEAKSEQAKERDFFLDECCQVLSFLNALDLVFFIEEDFLWVYLSFLLTKFRFFTKDKKATYIDRRKMALQLDMTETMANKITIDAQRKLALRSTTFVRENLSEDFISRLPCSFYDYLKEDLLERAMYPFFFSTLAGINAIKKEKILSCFEISSSQGGERILFYVRGEEILTEPFVEFKNEPMVVWKGWVYCPDKSFARAWKKIFLL